MRGRHFNNHIAGEAFEDDNGGGGAYEERGEDALTADAADIADDLGSTKTASDDSIASASETFVNTSSGTSDSTPTPSGTSDSTPTPSGTSDSTPTPSGTSDSTPTPSGTHDSIPSSTHDSVLSHKISDDDNDDHSYGASSIQVLKGLEAVRKRPGMYIGDISSLSGLHQMFCEVLDNAVDEHIAGYATQILVHIEQDGFVSIEDNGRGIPVSIHPQIGVSAAEVIMTHLHAGGKFDTKAYKISGGLHGVGVSVVNALSSTLELTVWRDEYEHYMVFDHSVPIAPLARGVQRKKHGTKVRFKADANVFAVTQYDLDMIFRHLRELTFLNAGLSIILTTPNSPPIKLQHSGGCLEFVNFLNKGKTHIIRAPLHFKNSNDNMMLEICLSWNDSYTENILFFTNNVQQEDGGTHVAGFRSALTRCVQQYTSKFIKQKKLISFTGEDIREGVVGVCSLYMPEPKFSSQTKEKLISTEARAFVDNCLANDLTRWLEENPDIANVIVNKAVSASEARAASKKARDIVRKKDTRFASRLPGKLADCQSSNPKERELLIVEGDSAGGSVKQGRDRKFQAVLPLRGKILNVARVRIGRMLESQEIRALVTALGLGLNNDNTFSIDDLRYHRIIIMTDADVDGAHIRTLLLTFLYKQVPELISNGHVFVAQPPLYKVSKGRQEKYLKDDLTLERYLLESKGETIRIYQAGDQLERDRVQVLLSQASRVDKLLRRFGLLYNINVLVQAWIAGTLSDNLFEDETMQKTFLERLKRVYSQYSNVSLSLSGTELCFDYYAGKARNSHRVPRGIFSCPEIDMLNTMDPSAFSEPLVCHMGKNQYSIDSPAELIDVFMKYARSGLSLQRYKGLGEMNPEQLWETTLDPSVRTLLQISVKHAQEADCLFDSLMGNTAQARREFIQKNALSALDIDI